MTDSRLTAFAVAVARVLTMERKGSKRDNAIAFISARQQNQPTERELRRALDRLPAGFDLEDMSLDELVCWVAD